jgi:hypothetical protein
MDDVREIVDKEKEDWKFKNWFYNNFSKEEIVKLKTNHTGPNKDFHDALKRCKHWEVSENGMIIDGQEYIVDDEGIWRHKNYYR